MFDRRKFFKVSTSALGLISLSPLSLSAIKNNSTLPSITDPIGNLRSQLLVPPDRIYMNTGSLGPSPQSVIDVVFNSMKKLESNPAHENWGELGNKMENVRSKIGGFINAPAEDIVLTRNTTEGLSLIGQTLKLNPGDEILTTTREHGGGEVVFEYMAQRDGAILRRVELPMPATSVTEIVETIESALTENTRVLMLSHVNTITGMKMPIEKISSLAKTRNIWLIIDGAQAPGLVNVDIEKLGVDAYASSGHKWMFGPKETGFLYLSKNLQKIFNPVFTSKGFKSYSAFSGTRNVSQIIGLGKSIDIHNEIGTKAIEKHCVGLADYCRKKLSSIEGTSIISPTHKDLRTGIVSLRLEKANNAEVSRLLAAKDIIVKTLPGINALRFSCHLLVSKEEIDRLVEELAALLA